MPRLAATLGVLAITGVVAFAQTSVCSCPAANNLYRIGGGDSDPLIWKFEAYQSSPPRSQQKQIICYVKHIENNSSAEVRDILWDVAQYRRDIIPAHARRPVCVQYAGEMKATPVQGPLYHGVSSQAYDTTVRPPEDGWLQKTADTLVTPSPSPETLKSNFIVDTQTKDGKLRTSRVSIESSASYDGKNGTFIFKVLNEGDGILGVRFNIPVLPSIAVDVSFAEKPIYLKPKQELEFKTTVAQKPEFVPATVIFYSEDGRRAGLDTAGFYVPAGGKTTLFDKDLWKPLR